MTPNERNVDRLYRVAESYERAIMQALGHTLPATNPKPTDVFWGLEGDARHAFKKVRMGRLYGTCGKPTYRFMGLTWRRKSKGFRRHVRRMKAKERA